MPQSLVLSQDSSLKKQIKSNPQLDLINNRIKFQNKITKGIRNP